MKRAMPALRVVRSHDATPSLAREAPKPTLDDAELLAALRAGDATAAASLHDRARPVIDRTLRRLLGASENREDVAQRTMIELVSSLLRFRGECSLDTWIARVTSHTAYKELRRKKLERAVFTSDVELDAQRDSLDVERDLIQRDALARVRKHLADIDPDKAWTIVLHDVCGHDLREIAEITQASISAAQTRLVRGRRELHERIAADAELADWLVRRGGQR